MLAGVLAAGLHRGHFSLLPDPWPDLRNGGASTLNSVNTITGFAFCFRLFVMLLGQGVLGIGSMCVLVAGNKSKPRSAENSHDT